MSSWPGYPGPPGSWLSGSWPSGSWPSGYGPPWLSGAWSTASSWPATFNLSAEIPLTTIFTPSQDCTLGPWVSSASTQGAITYTRQVTDIAGCYPSNFTDVLSYSNIYSPGVCPSGYTAARYWTTDGSDGTTSICCPSDMGYYQAAGVCSSVVSGPAQVLVSSTTSDATTPFTVFAPTIAVAWATKDLPSFTPSAAPLSVPTSSPTTTAPPSATPDAFTANTSNTSGLSTGAKAGIGVGCAVAALAAVCIVAWLLWRRKWRNRGTLQAQEKDSVSKAELAGEDAEKKFVELDGNLVKVELDGDGRKVEMPGQDKPTEVPVSGVHELPADWAGYEAGTTKKSPLPDE